jgi:glycosyltransferase involved in cell wall biosynthesis
LPHLHCNRDWNPATDKHIYQTYDINNFTEGKKANKVALQKELGLPVNPDIPLIAFIGRLDFQKGADIVMQTAPWMMEQGVQLVCLGTGSPDLEVRGCGRSGGGQGSRESAKGPACRVWATMSEAVEGCTSKAGTGKAL